MGIHSIPFPPEVDECDAARDYYARHEALIKGRRAGRLNLASALNPHKPGTQDYADWHRGWQEVQAERAAAQMERAEKARQIAAELRERARRCAYTDRQCDCFGVGRCLDVC